MATMYTKMVRFLQPRQSAGVIADMASQMLCDPTPAPRVMSLGLYQNDITPTADTVLADFLQADFTGYSAIPLNPLQVCTGNIQGPALGDDGEWQLFIDQKEFVLGVLGVPNSIFGAILFDSFDEFGFIFGVARFQGAPLSLSLEGDSIKVSGSWKFLPQMT